MMCVRCSLIDANDQQLGCAYDVRGGHEGRRQVLSLLLARTLALLFTLDFIVRDR